ncbi:hypothetical protein KEM56_004572 [Ascosphaera pollenicola]|nr:hypothetical protein KEM56_004572 [Ascosphaera pollenicola]
MATQQNAALADLAAAGTPHVVAEASLVEIAKGPLTNFIVHAGSADIGAVGNIWSCLLHTFSSSSLVPSHRTAICNAISAFFDSSLRSKNPELHAFALSRQRWESAYDVLLDRYEDSKPKPMRQVLGSLILVINKHPDRNVAKEILLNVIPTLTSTIILCEPRSRVKASIISIEWFLRKDALSALDLLGYVRLWLTERRNYSRWTQCLSKHCKTLRIPLSHYKEDATPIEGAEFHTAQLFIISVVLEAITLQILPSAGSLVSLLCQKLRALSSGDNLYPHTFHDEPFWLRPLRTIALHNFDYIEDLSHHVFFPLFKDEPSGFQRLLLTLPLSAIQTGHHTGADAKELMLLFFILDAAKELGVVHEDTEFKSANSSAALPNETYVLKSSNIAVFILHPEPAIRLSALSLLVTAPSTTKPFSDTALQVLKEKLPFICSDSDPQYRGEIFALLRRLIIRLRGGIATLQKGAASKIDPVILRSTSAESHVEFLRWYIHHLRSELHPAASYQRHISALKALILLTQTGLDSRIEKTKLSKLGNDQISWVVSVDIFSPELFQAAGNLLSDPFEDVRGSALSVLGLFPPGLLRDLADGQGAIKLPMKQLLLALERAEDMAGRTSRADHADAVARLYHLIFDLAQTQADGTEWYTTKIGVVRALLDKLDSHIFSTEEKLFHKAMRDRPFHGYVAALRHIVLTPKYYSLVDATSEHEQWRYIHGRVLSLCDKVWVGVRDVLCVDSPEGQHDDPSEELTGPKDILSCSWRALRESSLLLHAILSNLTYAPPRSLTRADFATIGDLSFTQLAELRHRGAFSTVSQTFAACCHRCGGAPDSSDIRELPPKWYTRILEIIDEQSTKLTRRSAGLPALVTGVAMFQPDGPFFSQIIADMQKIGSSEPEQSVNGSEMKLPQVHALNALKDLFTNTKFGPFTEPHIPASLQISSDCLGSPIWAIRNCGLMLFRALMLRMCRSGGGSKGFGGESGAEPGSRVVFENWRQIMPLLEALLKEEEKEYAKNEAVDARLGELTISTERVFPALELIGEKVPAALGKGDTALRDLVAKQFASPVWSIRDQAARIYASLIRVIEIPSTMDGFVSVNLKGKSENELHGRALCIRYALARVWHSTHGHWRHDLEAVLDIVLKVFTNYFRDNQAPFVLATVLEILNDAMIGLVKCGQESLVQTLYEDVISPADFSLILHGALSPSKSHFHRSSSLLFKAFIHATLIVHLAESLSEEEPDFLASAAVEEIDSCRWVLELIHRDFGHHAKSRHTRFELYISILDQDSPLELRHIAMSNMAKELTLLYSKESKLPEELQYLATWAEIAEIEDCDGEIWDREMCNASLHLQGCLLPLKMAFAGDGNLNILFEHEVSVYAQKLRFAAEDETEFSTRYAAAKSLKAFVAGLRISGVKEWKNEIFFEIYTVLYDILNDDDEEVRDLAAEIASWILSDATYTEKGERSLIPLAASEELIDFLCQTFGDSEHLCLQACNRMIGVADAKVGLAPVSELLRLFKEESTVLFEEEKQNLFIDQVRESERWAGVLSRIHPAAVDGLLLHEVYDWVLNGLDALIDSTRECELDGVLGWSSKEEIFTLGMKVLRSTGALLRIGNLPGPSCRDELLQKLAVFLDAGKQSMVNESWIGLAESIWSK